VQSGHRLPISLLFAHPPPTDIYTLPLHDALPICNELRARSSTAPCVADSYITACVSATHQCSRSANLSATANRGGALKFAARERSEEQTSELQSRGHLVCRLLLEKKKAHKHDDML